LRIANPFHSQVEITKPAAELNLDQQLQIPRSGGNGHLLPSIDIVQRLMKVFAVSADNLLNDKENSVVELQNHELNEQLMLINQLDEDEKNALVKIINSMLTKKRMKDLLDGKVNF
jgi:hypothetical protein